MPLSYAQDIRPLFRAGDISCMAQKGVLLGNTEWMCSPNGGDSFPDHENARRVFSVLSEGSMPPDVSWPRDKVAIFEQWMNDGFVE